MIHPSLLPHLQNMGAVLTPGSGSLSLPVGDYGNNVDVPLHGATHVFVPGADYEHLIVPRRDMPHNPAGVYQIAPLDMNDPQTHENAIHVFRRRPGSNDEWDHSHREQQDIFNNLWDGGGYRTPEQNLTEALYRLSLGSSEVPLGDNRWVWAIQAPDFGGQLRHHVEIGHRGKYHLNSEDRQLRVSNDPRHQNEFGYGVMHPEVEKIAKQHLQDRDPVSAMALADAVQDFHGTPEHYADPTDPIRYGATQEQLTQLLRDLYYSESDRQNHRDADQTKRLVTADALQDNGRDVEAALIRDGHPVAVRVPPAPGTAPLAWEGSTVEPDYTHHVWPGGVPVAYLHKSGDVLCPDCMNRMAMDRAKALATGEEPDVEHPKEFTPFGHEEGPPIDCAECDNRIESAYGDPDAPEGEDYDAPTEPVNYGEGDQSDLEPLLRSIPMNAWRGWNHENFPTHINFTPRLAAADLLEELGRLREAAIMRDTRRHAYLGINGPQGSLYVNDTADMLPYDIRSPLRGDSFIRNYAQTALATTLSGDLDDEGIERPLEDFFQVQNIHPRTAAAMIADADHFRALHGDDQMYSNGGRDGGDLWYSRHGHGTGFFDNEEHAPEDRERLQNAAREFGEHNLFAHADDSYVHGDYEAPDLPPLGPNGESSEGEQQQYDGDGGTDGGDGGSSVSSEVTDQKNTDFWRHKTPYARRVPPRRGWQWVPPTVNRPKADPNSISSYSEEPTGYAGELALPSPPLNPFSDQEEPEPQHLDAVHHHHANMAHAYRSIGDALAEAGHHDAAQVADWFADEHRNHKMMAMYFLRQTGQGWPEWAKATDGHPDPTDEQFDEAEHNVRNVLSRIRNQDVPDADFTVRQDTPELMEDDAEPTSYVHHPGRPDSVKHPASGFTLNQHGIWEYPAGENGMAVLISDPDHYPVGGWRATVHDDTLPLEVDTIHKSPNFRTPEELYAHLLKEGAISRVQAPTPSLESLDLPEETHYVHHEGKPDSFLHPASGFTQNPKFPDYWSYFSPDETMLVQVNHGPDYSQPHPWPRVYEGKVYDRSDISSGPIHVTPKFTDPVELWNHMLENGIIDRPQVEPPALEDLDLNAEEEQPTEYAGPEDLHRLISRHVTHGDVPDYAVEDVLRDIDHPLVGETIDRARQHEFPLHELALQHLHNPELVHHLLGLRPRLDRRYFPESVRMRDFGQRVTLPSGRVVTQLIGPDTAPSIKAPPFVGGEPETDEKVLAPGSSELGRSIFLPHMYYPVSHVWHSHRVHSPFVPGRQAPGMRTVLDSNEIPGVASHLDPKTRASVEKWHRANYPEYADEWDQPQQLSRYSVNYTDPEEEPPWTGTVGPWDQRGFWKAINENPLESAHHHTYADWLEERGYHDEAAFRRSIANWMQYNPPMYNPGFVYNHPVRGEESRPWIIPGLYTDGYDNAGRLTPHRYPEGVRGVTEDLYGILRDRHGNLPREGGDSGPHLEAMPHHPVYVSLKQPVTDSPDIQDLGMAWPTYHDMENSLHESFMDGLHRQRQEEAAQQPKTTREWGRDDDPEAPINNAMNYALMPRESVYPFIKAHHEGDRDAQRGLADYLQENDDPRGMIISRALGITRHPHHALLEEAGGGYTPRDEHDKPINPVYFESGQYADQNNADDPLGVSILGFYPSVVEDENGNLIYSVYASSRFDQRRPDPSYESGLFQGIKHSANFDEDEARVMAEQLPDPYRQQLHTMLNKTFRTPAPPPEEETPEQFARYEFDNFPFSMYTADMETTNYTDLDTVNYLLHQLAQEEHNQTRWGNVYSPDLNRGGDRTFRQGVSDALRDVGRDREANWLADPDRHVIVTPERTVIPGRFTDRHINQALADHSNAWQAALAHNVLGEPIYDPTDFFDFDRTGTRYPAESFVDPYEHDPDFMEGPGEVSPGHLRVVTGLNNDQDYLGYHDAHYSELGNHLADLMDQEWDGHVDWEGVGEEQRNAIDQTAHALRTAPYEEEDVDETRRHEDPYRDVPPEPPETTPEPRFRNAVGQPSLPGMEDYATPEQPVNYAGLPLAEAHEHGVRFATGEPVSFHFVRNTEKAPRPSVDDPYQQNLEPLGRYMLHRHPSAATLPPGWESGSVSFQNPLVVHLTTDPEGRIYSNKSWKAHLAHHFGVTGKELTGALRDAGHDGVVTVRSPEETSEIMDLSEPPALYEQPVNYASGRDLAAILRNLRQNSYDNTTHGVFADALEEAYPDSPVPELIRQKYGVGQHSEDQSNDFMYWEPFYNSWDGTFPYAARLGRHGPFRTYLAHEGSPHVQGDNQRWLLHLVSNLPGSKDSGYTFEFPHDQAHLIPQMFPEAAAHIAPTEEVDKLAHLASQSDAADDSRRLWVLNHEPIYRQYVRHVLHSGGDINEADPIDSGFVQNNREMIDKASGEDYAGDYRERHRQNEADRFVQRMDQEENERG